MSGRTALAAGATSRGKGKEGNGQYSVMVA
jgi:hypothetical protein